MRQPEQRSGGWEDESAALFDYALIRDYIGFVFRAVRRRRKLALVVFALTLGAAVLSLVALPKSYHVETKILAQRNQVMAALGNPTRAIPGEADSPTRAASETVLRLDNLVSLIKQTDLLDRWDQTRAPAVRLKDLAVGLVRGKPKDEDRIDALVGLLEKRLSVATGEGTVTIAIDWPDAQLAYRLVDTAQQNFLEARHASEISTIAEAISILEGHAAAVRESIDGTIDEIQKQREVRDSARPGKPAAAPVTRRPRRLVPEDQEIAQLKVMLTAKRRAILDLEEFRQKRLAEKQSLLAEQRAIYADSHPTIVDIQQSIAALQQESLQITALRREEVELRGELARRGGKESEAAAELPPPAPAPLPRETASMTRAQPNEVDDQAMEYARSRLRFSMSKYDNLLDRIDSARIELDTARAAFKYRYSVVKPAQLPKSPEKPKPAVLLVGGAVAALVLAIFAAVAADLRAGRVVESWQVARVLELPLLGEVSAP